MYRWSLMVVSLLRIYKKFVKLTLEFVKHWLILTSQNMVGHVKNIVTIITKCVLVLGRTRRTVAMVLEKPKRVITHRTVI